MASKKESGNAVWIKPSLYRRAKVIAANCRPPNKIATIVNYACERAFPELERGLVVTKENAK